MFREEKWIIKHTCGKVQNDKNILTKEEEKKLSIVEKKGINGRKKLLC